MAEAEADEALFLAMASVVQQLVENGAITATQLRRIETAFRLQSERAIVQPKKANTSLAADYVEVFRRMAEGEAAIHARPLLRVVQSDDEETGAPEGSPDEEP